VICALRWPRRVLTLTGTTPEVPAYSGGGPAPSPTGLLYNLGLAPLLCGASGGRGVPREEGEG